MSVILLLCPNQYDMILRSFRESSIILITGHESVEVSSASLQMTLNLRIFSVVLIRLCQWPKEMAETRLFGLFDDRWSGRWFLTIGHSL